MEIWFFTSIDVGLRTRTEVYTMIYERMRKEGIEVPALGLDLRLGEGDVRAARLLSASVASPGPR